MVGLVASDLSLWVGAGELVSFRKAATNDIGMSQLFFHCHHTKNNILPYRGLRYDPG
jgi:hypothetical protein